eukprot:12932936-Alexandrium_andersonii.AAC.1
MEAARSQAIDLILRRPRTLDITWLGFGAGTCAVQSCCHALGVLRIGGASSSSLPAVEASDSDPRW